MSQELDDFLRRREQAASAPARASVKAAAAQGIQPDAAAQHAATARRYGVSPAVVAASPELFKQEDAADEADRIITSAPKLGDWLAQREHNAAMARDDLAPMSDAEKTITTRAPRESITSRLINAAKLPAQAIAGAVDYWTLGAGAAPVLPTLRAAREDLTGWNTLRALGSGMLGIGTGATGVAAAASALSPFELAFRAVNQADATPTQMILESAGKYLSGAQQAVRPQAKTAEGRGILSGIESTPASVVAAVGGAYMKSATAGAMLMGGVTGGQSFLTGRQAGLSTEAALAYGSIDAAVEFGTEKLPMDMLIGPQSVGSSFISRFVKSTAAEIPGEQIATFLQDFNAWGFIESNKGKTFGDFIAERPGAAYETLIASMVTTGAVNIAAEGLHRAGAVMGREYTRAAPAERDAEVLDVLGQIAAASKVAQRDPGSFEDFVRQAADGTTAEDVFIDANQLSIVLEQSGLSPTQAAELTGIAVEDMQLAVQTGADLRIPIETYAARVANSDIGPALLDHLRIDPESMSRAEAKVFMQSAETELQSLVDAQTTLVLKSDAERASRDAVKEQILGELNTAGRFSPSVNEAYATLHATAMANIAARQGMTAEELAQRYGLRVQSGEVSQPTFDQGKPAKPQWMADILESAQVRKDTAVRLSTEGKPIRFTGENGRSAIAGPDMSKPGGYRLTYFDEAGPSGHVEFNTLTEAADEALKSRFVPEQGPSIEEQHAADPNSAVNRYNQDAVFYSALQRAVEAQKTNKAPGAQWIATLKKAPGVKQEEIEWSGLLDFLQMQEGQPVTKQQITELLEGGGIRTDEVVLGDPVGAGWTVVEENGVFFPVDPSGAYGDPESSEGQAWRMIKQDAEVSTQFKDWSSDPSNDSYRELLITLPLGEGKNPARAPSTHWDTEAVVAHARFMEKTDADGAKVLFVEEVQSDWHQKGRDQGYSQPVDPAELEKAFEALRAAYDKMSNLRDALHADAEKLIAKAKETTFKEEGPYGLADVKWSPSRNGSTFDKGKDAARFLSQITDEDGAAFDKYLADQEALNAALLAENEARQAYRNAQGGGGGGIPDAPFRASWPALVMKRMIRWAVDNGYQKIAWTTGEQQAERYSLSQAVGGLEAEKRADGLYLVQADNTQAIDTVVSNGMAERDPESFHKAVMTADQMKQAFGANIADQLAAGADANRAAFAEGDTLSADLLMAELEDKPAAEIEAMRARLAELNREGPTSRRFRLEGEENLRVGGEGMKAFYDRNLVNITNDLIKRYGAKVGSIPLEDTGSKAAQRQQDLRNEIKLRGGLAVAGADTLVEVEQRIADWSAMTNNPKAQRWAEQLREVVPLFQVLESIDATVTQPGFEITPQLAEVASKGFPLFQRTGQARGQIALAPDITSQPSIITLLRGADLSTFLHESGHFYWEVMTDLAGRPGASAEVRQDVQRMLDFVGVPDLPTWLGMTTADKREHHEKIARSFEAYLFENKAPSPELRGLFGRFAQWLRAVYKELTGLNVELTDEVRGVFDRMLASDQEIAEAQMAQGLEPLLVERPEGVLDSEWAGYQREGLEATEEAVRELASRSLRDMQYAGRAAARELKRLRRESSENRKTVKAEVDAELRAEPVYRAIRYLRTGQLDDQPKIDGESYKLHTGLVREILGLDASEPLPASLNGMTSTDNGANPQQLADLFGYSSANQLLHDLLFASPIADAIEAETDNRMRERFGELSSPEALESAVQSAIHNDVRGRFVATELAMLQKAPGKRRALTAAASKLARDTIERLKLRSVRPGQYEAGERRAARLAAETRGNLAEAAAHKRNQLLQFHLAKEAHAAREEADNIRRYLTKFGNANTRKAIDKSFLDQIDTLLEAVQLKPISDLEAQRRTEMSKWIESMRDEGFEPAFDADFLAQINKRAWRDLTVDEIRQLQEAVKNIEWLGRRTKELLTAKDKADLDQAANEVADSIRTFATRSFEEGVGSPSWWDKVKSGARDFLAQHRKFANMVYVIDGNKYGGAAWERFTRGMNEAGDRETMLNADATRRLAAIFKPLDGMDLHSKHFEPEIGKSVSLETRLMTALNWGNATNRARVMDGDGWTQEQVEKLLEPLTDEHWTFVENVWDFIDSYWPDISAKQERVTGVLPEKVVAEPFQFTPKDGAMRLLRGGYFPIKFDPDRSSKAEADTAAEVLTQMKRGLYTNATTRRGHIKERVDTVRGRPIRKDFGVIFGHTTQVIHDLAWHETLIDTNRLLRHGAIDAALREHYGPEVLRWMRKALEDIATGDIPAQNAFERSVNYVRAGASISAMGWSIWTSLLQPVGLTQSIARIGVKHVARGIGDLFGSPKAMNDKIEWVYSVSPFMQERARTMQREVNEIRNKISPKSPLRRSIERVVPAPAADFVADSWFYMLGKAQLVADLPTWLGQYEKSMDAGESPDRAVAIADQAVIDSQSSGLIKDLAGIQRGGPVLKLWTSFYSYFSATYNLLVDRTHELKRKGAGDLPYFAADVAMLTFVPATITSVMYGVLKGGDDDEPEDWLKRIAADNLNYMLGTMIGVREVGGALTGFAGYSGPAGARVFSAVGNLGKQVAQGEIDEAALRSANAVGGVLLHYPSAQIDKTVRGLIQYANGDAGPQAVLVGPPPKK